MPEAERVLAELATKIHSHSISYNTIRELTAPYLPKPEPDRLTVAAREICAMFSDGPCEADGWKRGEYDELTESNQIRAIIAREVAAVEPSDEAIRRAADYLRPLMLSGGVWTCDEIRATLKGEGA